jgi:hypothetical protein
VRISLTFSAALIFASLTADALAQTTFATITGTVLNHPNYSNPGLVVNTAASAGVITAVGGVNGGATGDNPGVRVFRTALRVEF